MVRVTSPGNGAFRMAKIESDHHWASGGGEKGFTEQSVWKEMNARSPRFLGKRVIIERATERGGCVDCRRDEWNISRTEVAPYRSTG